MWNQLVVDEQLSLDTKMDVQERLNELKCDLGSGYFAKQPRQVRNLVEFDDGFLIWNPQKELVYHVMVKNFNQVASVQKFLPTHPPMFDVCSLQLNGNRRYLLLSGQRALNVIEMPRKYSSQLLYEGGKQDISVKSWSLVERFFVCNDKVALLESHWHPGSIERNHVVMLTNDNHIRIIDINEPSIAVQEINLSIEDESTIDFGISIFARSLGESAVSFDFGPPVHRSTKFQKTNRDTSSRKNGTLSITHSPKGKLFTEVIGGDDPTEKGASADQLIDIESVYWPIYILKGNGDILLVYNSLFNIYVSKKINGPLKMYPSAEDNYGVDACSLIVLNSNPPLVAIGTSTGMIHHCIALQENEEDSSAFLPNVDLYVYESLELTLTLSSSIEMDNPMKLIKNGTSLDRYFCSHLSGIHVINIPFLSQLQKSNFTGEPCQETVVEHLICTRPIATADRNEEINFPIGVTMAIQKKFLLMVLLSNGEIFSQRLSAINFVQRELKIPCKDSNETPNSKLEQLKPVEFTERIAKLLQRKTNAPLINSKSGDIESNGKECFQFLLNSTQMLREDYLAKFDAARELIEHRAASLSKDKQVQMMEIGDLDAKRNEILDQTKKLQQKYSQSLIDQQKLSTRLDKIVDLLLRNQSQASDAEVRVAKEMQMIKEKIETYRNCMNQIELKLKYKEEINSNSHSTGVPTVAKSPGLLSNKTRPSDLQTVQKILNHQTEEISCLLQYVNFLKQHGSE